MFLLTLSVKRKPMSQLSVWTRPHFPHHIFHSAHFQNCKTHRPSDSPVWCAPAAEVVSRPVTDSRPWWTGREGSSQFSRLFVQRKEKNKMNFPFDPFQPHCRGQIEYWSASLCLLRESLACQNRSPVWRPPISQLWLILCSLWPVGPNQGWWAGGWGGWSEVAVGRCTWSVEQSRLSDPHSLCPCPSAEEEMDTGRRVVLFIHSEGLDAINTGRVGWWWMMEAEQGPRLWYCVRGQKKGKLPTVTHWENNSRVDCFFSSERVFSWASWPWLVRITDFPERLHPDFFVFWCQTLLQDSSSITSHKYEILIHANEQKSNLIQIRGWYFINHPDTEPWNGMSSCVYLINLTITQRISSHYLNVIFFSLINATRLHYK